MKRLTLLTVVVTALTLLAASALADTLFLKNGTRVTGYYEGGTTRTVKFRGSDGASKDYDILQVQEIQFGDTTAGATATAPQLRPASERPPAQPSSSNAANTAYTVPTGTKVVIQLIDSINSETNKLGSVFVAVLDEPVMLNGIEVVPRGADIRGRIANVNEAGRVAGAAELGLELTQIYVNGIPYAMTTSEYAAVGENRTGQTVRRVGAGAGVGAIIGAIAGGGRGAAIGAGVGAGVGTAAQVLTKGEKLNIPSETKLEFTLRTPLVVAAR